MNNAEQILDTLTTQKFHDWYEGDFADYITAVYDCADEGTERACPDKKQKILRQIEELFKLDKNDELVEALRAMLNAYAPNAQKSVDDAGGNENILHSAVRLARKTLRNQWFAGRFH